MPSQLPRCSERRPTSVDPPAVYLPRMHFRRRCLALSSTLEPILAEHIRV
jgi:hypothetical protein